MPLLSGELNQCNVGSEKDVVVPGPVRAYGKSITAELSTIKFDGLGLRVRARVRGMVMVRLN